MPLAIRSSLLALALAACAHTGPDALTADEHRAEAVKHQTASAEHRDQYQPDATARTLAPRTPFSDDGSNAPQFYNPTAHHLTEADLQMQAAFSHLKAAEALDKFENQACAGLSAPERSACPLLNPHVVKVEETAQGVKLHLRAEAPVARLAGQLKCHLAWAKAKGFERTPCPLYVRGVAIDAREGAVIEVHSSDPAVAGQVRKEARLMFGVPTEVSAR
jgi:hypothetical protein